LLVLKTTPRRKTTFSPTEPTHKAVTSANVFERSSLLGNVDSVSLS
jgi:hypothetical protein